jgi:recombination protein RecT
MSEQKAITPFEKTKSLLTSPDFMSQVGLALPKHIDPGKMIRVVITSMMRTPKLAQCTTASITRCVLEASQLGLMPDGVTGMAWLIPFKNNKANPPVMEAQLMVGYRGMLALARQSGAVKSIHAQVVHEKDEFEYTLGDNPGVKHVPPKLGEGRGKPIGAYALARLESDEIVFEVLSAEEIEAVRRRSKSASDGPWITDPLAMWRKTAIRRLFKYLPASVDRYEDLVAREEAIDLGYDPQDVIDVEAIGEPERPEPALERLTKDLEQRKAASKSEPAQKPKAAPKAAAKEPVVVKSPGFFPPDDEDEVMAADDEPWSDSEEDEDVVIGEPDPEPAPDPKLKASKKSAKSEPVKPSGLADDETFRAAFKPMVKELTIHPTYSSEFKRKWMALVDQFGGGSVMDVKLSDRHHIIAALRTWCAEAGVEV